LEAVVDPQPSSASLKRTHHCEPDTRVSGVDVQKASSGVFGNAVWLIVGPGETIV
jgi:hypothetical protein